MHGTLHPSKVEPVFDFNEKLLSDEDATFQIVYPEEQTVPLIFASPHSGRGYPKEFIEACEVDVMDMRRIEDAFVDILLSRIPNLGAPCLNALVSRACVDLNRSSGELDATMFSAELEEIVLSRSPRVVAGLGCIPRIAHGGAAIYKRKLRPEIAVSRLHSIYHPYHDALNSLVEATLRKFGIVMLIDCHSMPSQTESGAKMPDIVLGDRFGSACMTALTKFLEKALKTRGYSVARNTPYAGGYTTSSHGRPEDRRHAIQIEISRRLYMSESSVEPNKNFERFHLDLHSCFAELASWSLDKI